MERGKKGVESVIEKFGNMPVRDISPESIEHGREAIDSFLKKYGEMPVSDLDAVDYVSSTWENRPKANMVKWLMTKASVSVDTLAAYLGCSRQYLNNKLTRDSFSFDDLVIAAYACGFTFTLTSNDEEDANRCAYRVDLVDYFKACDDEVLVRISEIEKESHEARRAEYESKKAELERMKREFGFED